MQNSTLQRRGGADWEAALGRDLRTLRLRKNLTQAELARQANVSESAVRALERGDGSRVRTLVQVTRALGREDWLAAVLPPEPAISPMQVLRDQQQQVDRVRVRASPVREATRG